MIDSCEGKGNGNWSGEAGRCVLSGRRIWSSRSGKTAIRWTTERHKAEVTGSTGSAEQGLGSSYSGHRPRFELDRAVQSGHFEKT